MSRKVSTRFVVEGSGPFPIDMLRFDACYPCTPDDVFAISAPSAQGPRTVALRHRIGGGEMLNAIPTKGRWASFGWHVRTVEHFS